MVILCRPVKQNHDSDEIQNSHIHLVTYDDNLRKVCCHYVHLEEREDMISWARKFQEECWLYNQSVKKWNEALKAGCDDDIVLQQKLANKNLYYDHMLSIIRECKWPLILDTSLIVNVDDLDAYGFELLGYHEDLGEVNDTMKYCVLDSTNPYFTGSMV